MCRPRAARLCRLRAARKGVGLSRQLPFGLLNSRLKRLLGPVPRVIKKKAG